jgi:cytochrome c551/c552
VRQAAQQVDRLGRRGALIEHHANDHDAGKSRQPRADAYAMQADDQATLVQSVEPAREDLARC